MIEKQPEADDDAENPNAEKPLPPVSDADVYLKTRKRDPKRDYMLPTKDIEEKIVSILLLILSLRQVRILEIH